MATVDEYLRIPAEYGQALGGLRWSIDCEAIERQDGTTFALGGEIIGFLEGFAQQRPFPHFALVLHLIGLLRWPRAQPTDPLHRLHRLFREAAAVHRNAGAFCALLCRDLPPAPDPPSSLQVWRRVVLRSFSTSQEFLPRRLRGEEPPLTPAVFEEHLRQALATYDDQEILHWLKHAHGPVKEPARRVAEALQIERPRSLQGALAELAQQERLAGALPFVAQLVSALSLPPRRLAVPELPLGGYSDVSTRGHPEHILPSQFALDDLEFVRRHAEHELLYYRREEPQTQTREELLVLLDQGVRTWGTVRLVLAAALLAFGRLADRRRLGFLVAATSGGGAPRDPLRLSGEELAELVETSDLTANPALALERALEQEAAQPRDVVLLTHPFNLDEPDLAVAARRVRPGCRLFALTVDAHGQVQLSELRGGVPLAHARFQVDLDPARSPSRTRLDPQVPWTGDVEPVGFPFCFGLEHDARGQLLFAFDHSGEWLLTASNGDLLHAWKIDGSAREVWPRGMIGGEVLRDVHAVLGVAGGFVVAGVLRGGLAACHYDLGSRCCRSSIVVEMDLALSTGSLAKSQFHWAYDRELHCVVVSLPGRLAAWDLAEERPASAARPSQGPRVARALHKVSPFRPGPPYLEVSGSFPIQSADHGWVDLDERSGRLEVFLPDQGRREFLPLKDGQPALRGWSAIHAQCSGSTLALALLPTSNARKGEVRLALYRLTDGVPLGEHLQSPDHWAFVLSDDGRMLARQVRTMEVEIRWVPGMGKPWVAGRVKRGEFHSSPLVLLGDRWLAIQIDGRITHIVRWDQGTLVHHVHLHGNLTELLRHDLHGTSLSETGVRAELGRLPAWCAYDPQRFQRTAWSNLIAVVDRFGQVFLFGKTGRLPGAFFAHCEQLAVWLSEGTCYGPPRHLGRRPTPNAPEIIGQALREASNAGERTIR